MIVLYKTSVTSNPYCSSGRKRALGGLGLSPCCTWALMVSVYVISAKMPNNRSFEKQKCFMRFCDSVDATT